MQRKTVGLVLVLCLVLAGSAWAKTSKIATRAVSILKSEHQADLKELVKLKIPVLPLLEKTKKQIGKVIKEAGKPNLDKAALSRERGQLQKCRAELNKVNKPYLKKLNAVAKVILGKINKAGSLKGKALKKAEQEVLKAINNEVSALAAKAKKK